MPMINAVTVLVRDYEEAKDFFTRALRFETVEDTALTPVKRWIVVRPRNAPEGSSAILLAQPSSERQAARIGRQGEDRVMFFLETDNFARDHAHMLAEGVTFLEAPRREAYGTVAVFKDISGNRWDLIERTQTGSP